MIVEVVGKAPKKYKKELISAAYFYAARLLTDRACDKIDLEIALIKNLEAKGYCENLDGGRHPRVFRIELKPEELYETLTTLAHEMVHLKQYATGELKEKNLTLYRWQGKMVKTKGIDYYDLPWEIDAYGREIGLRLKYLAINPHIMDKYYGKESDRKSTK